MGHQAQSSPFQTQDEVGVWKWGRSHLLRSVHLPHIVAGRGVSMALTKATKFTVPLCWWQWELVALTNEDEQQQPRDTNLFPNSSVRVIMRCKSMVTSWLLTSLPNPHRAEALARVAHEFLLVVAKAPARAIPGAVSMPSHRGLRLKRVWQVVICKAGKRLTAQLEFCSTVT